MLAMDGAAVAVVDAAWATQGLADYVEGRIDPDLTRVVADDAPLSAAECAIEGDWLGSLSVYPAMAPFERIARAKTAGAAEQFERSVASIAQSADVVLIDTPPIAANQAVAATSVADRVVVMAPDTPRGASGLVRQRERLADVGTSADAVLANFADGDRTIEEAAAAIPTGSVTSARAAPESPGGGALAGAVQTAVESLFEVSLEVDAGGAGGWRDVLSR